MSRGGLLLPGKQTRAEQYFINRFRRYPCTFDRFANRYGT
nr:H107 [uncultured bacterium]